MAAVHQQKVDGRQQFALRQQEEGGGGSIAIHPQRLLLLCAASAALNLSLLYFHLDVLCFFLALFALVGNDLSRIERGKTGRGCCGVGVMFAVE